VIEVITQWMRAPLDLPEEFRGWLPRFLETTDVTYTLENITNGAQSAVPIGAMLDWPTNTAPSFYLICDGSAVNRSTYAALFAVLGTTYGAGDGSTTFNVPDYRGRVVIYRHPSQSDVDTVGETGGSSTITSGNLPAHTHSISTDGDHGHTLTAGGQFYTSGSPTAGVTLGASVIFGLSGINNSGSHNHGAATGSVGSGTAYRPPYIVANKIIRAL
jgi:microcystin-dependent protein